VAFIAVMHIHMKARYYRVHRLVVLPDYQGIGLGKRLLNFIAELYSSQTKAPFYIVTSNPQIVRGNMDRWVVRRYGHVKRSDRQDTRINSEIKSSVSTKRISLTLEYKPKRLVDVAKVCLKKEDV
jgi:GNAT superfamily N-acetyltransferase